MAALPVPGVILKAIRVPKLGHGPSAMIGMKGHLLLWQSTEARPYLCFWRCKNTASAVGKLPIAAVAEGTAAEVPICHAV